MAEENSVDLALEILNETIDTLERRIKKYGEIFFGFSDIREAISLSVRVMKCAECGDKNEWKEIDDYLDKAPNGHGFVIAVIHWFAAKRSIEEGGWTRAMRLIPSAMCELSICCSENLAVERFSKKASENARKRHTEHYALKEQALAFYDENQALFKSLDSAAEHISTKVVPVAFRTARKWLGDHKKLRSAGKK